MSWVQSLRWAGIIIRIVCFWRRSKLWALTSPQSPKTRHPKSNIERRVRFRRRIWHRQRISVICHLNRAKALVCRRWTIFKYILADYRKIFKIIRLFYQAYSQNIWFQVLWEVSLLTELIFSEIAIPGQFLVPCLFASLSTRWILLRKSIHRL